MHRPRLCRIVTVVLTLTALHGTLPGNRLRAREQDASASAGRPSTTTQRARVAWGRTVKDLAIGLSTARMRLPSDAAIPLTIHIINTNNRGATLRNVTTASGQSWSITFTEKRPNGLRWRASPVTADKKARLPHAVLKGGADSLIAVYAGHTQAASGWYFQSASKKVSSLPPGRYSVTVSYCSGKATPRGGNWHGRLTTGSLDIHLVLSTRARDAKLATLKKAMGRSERALVTGTGAARARLYSSYVLDSQRYLLALTQAAERETEDPAQRKLLATRIDSEIRAWLRRQRTVTFEPPPEGARMWMRLYLGRGLALAGKHQQACTQGFDRVIAFDPSKFPPGAARAWAWRVSLTARFYRGLALYQQRKWEQALKSIDPAFFVRPESKGRLLGIRAHLLVAQCLGQQGKYTLSSTEFNQVFDEIRALRGRGTNQAVIADKLRRRAVLDMAGMVAMAVQDGVRMRAKEL
jgi:tetratricopeptide (TPR) repeat protein